MSSQRTRLAALEKHQGGNGAVRFVLHQCDATPPADAGELWTCPGCGAEVFTLDLGNTLDAAGEGATC